MKTFLSIILLLLCQAVQAQTPKTSIRSSDQVLRRIAHLEEMIYDLSDDLEVFFAEQDSIKRSMPEHGIYFSLGLAVQYFHSRPSVYYVDRQNKLASHALKGGSDLAINGIMGFKLHKQHALIMSFPLLTLSNKPGHNIGLLGSQKAYGVGYSYTRRLWSLFACMNIEPYQIPIHSLVKDRVFYQEPYSSIDLDQVPHHTVYNTGLSIGAAYQLWQKN